jgi:site-specific recombinase XerD
MSVILKGRWYYVFGSAFIRLFKIYWRTYRPLLLESKDSLAVFISRTARMKTPAELGAQIPKFIKKRTGIVINLHLFRHLAGYLFLKANPGQYEPVRQLRGHKSIATTLGFYVGLEEEDAFRRYDEVIDAYRQEDEDGDDDPT